MPIEDEDLGRVVAHAWALRRAEYHGPRFRYTCQQLIGELGLYYRARFTSQEIYENMLKRRMTLSPSPHARDVLVSYFWSGDAIRSRSVSDLVLSGTVDVPVPPARLWADWERETSMRLGLEPGDVEPLPLARARARWPDYRHCVHAVSDWMRTLGLQEVLASSDVALMACRGAKYHHDGAHYGGAAFCNLFLSEDKGLDLHFPAAGRRIPLARGTAVIFDTGQPHAVIRRHSGSFDVADFGPDQDCTQVFLTWELPVEHGDVGRVLGVDFDIDPSTSLQLDEEQVWLNGAQARVCPDSGRWFPSNGSMKVTTPRSPC